MRARGMDHSHRLLCQHKCLKQCSTREQAETQSMTRLLNVKNSKSSMQRVSVQDTLPSPLLLTAGSLDNPPPDRPGPSTQPSLFEASLPLPFVV